MNPIDEMILKAQHAVWFLESDLLAAYQESLAIVKLSPCGGSKRDNALIAYLGLQLEAARNLQTALLALGGKE